ncbi:hypothetical protein D9M72_487350 [compost metagenome]
MAIDELNEGKRRMQRKRRARTEIDIRRLQRFAQDIAEHVVGKAGEEAGGNAEPTERDRRIEDRPAGIGCERTLARGRVPRQHVDQRFTTTYDHRHFSPEDISIDFNDVRRNPRVPPAIGRQAR